MKSGLMLGVNPKTKREENDFIGIELNPEYIKIAEKRLQPYLNKQLGDF